jgi:ribosomal silencing factor RsfS
MDSNIIIKQLGNDYIVLCFCNKCKGTNPVVISEGSWSREKKRLCEQAKEKMKNRINDNYHTLFIK